MAEKSDNTMLYTAVYTSKDDALADLEAVEQLHKDKVIGEFDAAVVDHKDGKPHVEKRLDRPRVHFIPEMFGGGKLPRKELHEAAAELLSDQAGLIVIGDLTLDKALEKAITHAGKVAKHSFDSDVDTIASELNEAIKESSTTGTASS
jgi:uncharacterized membrane protein